MCSTSCKLRFAYAFEQSDFYRPIVEARELGEELALRRSARPLRRSAARRPDVARPALRRRRVIPSAYAIDFSDLTDDMAALYEGVDVWIADCLTRKPHPTHMHLDGVLGWARDLRVGQLYLVHMGNGLDYRTLVAELPDWAAPAYDGLEIAS